MAGLTISSPNQLTIIPKNELNEFDDALGAWEAGLISLFKKDYRLDLQAHQLDALGLAHHTGVSG